MVAPVGISGSRQSFAVNLQLTRGRYGAAARVELHERPGGRLAAVALRGWIDPAAVRRIEQALDDLAGRGATHLLVDCSQLRHVDYRMVPRLVGAFSRFESRTGSVALCGLSRYLRDLFRLTGCDEPLQHWPSVAEVIGGALAAGSCGERAS